MKIGIDIRTLMDKNYSGVSEYTFNLLKHLFAVDHDNEYVLFYNSGKNISDRIPKFEYINVKTIHRRYPNKLFNYCLQKIFKWPKIDRLIDADLFFMPHINFTALSSKAKKIITIHDLSYLKFNDFFSKRKNIWHSLVNAKNIIKQSDYVVAISKNTKNDIIELTNFDPEKIKVIYSGIDKQYKKIADKKILDQIKQKYKLPDNYILYLGNVEPRKNIIGLLKAYDYLLKKFKLNDYKLVVAGNQGWKTELIMKEYIKLDNNENIKFLGYIAPEDKPAMYNLASIFVYPSFYEGFGFPVLEAMACGVPVVTSNISSLPEISEQAALLVNPYNTNDIAEAIKKILCNKPFKNYLIEKGLTQASKFSWAKTCQNYLNLFQI